MAKKTKNSNNDGLIAQNKKGRFDFFIEEEIEAGVVLTGTEVKSLRNGGGSITECYAAIENNELYLINSYIPVYENAGTHLQHKPRRRRKLLVKRAQINKFIGLTKQKSYTLVPLKLYFTAKGRVKALIGLAKGKKQHDKRAAIKDREWKVNKARLLKTAQ